MHPTDLPFDKISSPSTSTSASAASSSSAPFSSSSSQIYLWEALQQPGDVLVVPGTWLQSAEALEVSQGFSSEPNWDPQGHRVNFRSDLGDVMADLREATMAVYEAAGRGEDGYLAAERAPHRSAR